MQRGSEYVSAKEMAVALGGSYYINKNSVKIELKFKNYKLKITARNPFVILISRNDNSQYIFQIPISTLLIGKNIFIPLKYYLPYLEILTGKNIIFNKKEKLISVGNKKINSLAVLENVPSKNVSKTQTTVKKHINSPYDIYKISIEKKANGTLIRLKTQKPLNTFRTAINNGTLFLFLSGVTVDPKLITETHFKGLVKKIKIVNVKNNVQVEFGLRKGYQSQESFVDQTTGDLLITIHNKFLTNKEKQVNELKQRWNFHVIVIDPGHGGKDDGAIGVDGVREKDINLSIALKLGKMITKNMKGVKVVFTRKTDKFVELYKRGEIANKNHGNLFISIHCNSLRKKPSSINGTEVFLLRPGRTKEAIKIAEFENSVIRYEDHPHRYKKLTAENFILVSMAHSAYMRYSEKFAGLLNQDFSKYTRLKSRGAKQAGFYVLVGASMPAVLIETGFISNRKDEKYLASSRGQYAIAKAVFNAIKSYRRYYKKTSQNE